MIDCYSPAVTDLAVVTEPSCAPGRSLVLSLFPGADLFGRGFELEGYCVVRGPDVLWGADVRDFVGVPGRFDGVIGGPPCQDFSGLNRSPGGYGREMLAEYLRVVSECQPDWFVMENVARVPDVVLSGYTVQRFDLNANECGLAQSRLRHFQFGSRRGCVVTLQRGVRSGVSQSICLASEGDRSERRSFADFCELQGLPRDFDLPGLSVAASYRAVGNGVPVPMARVVARAVTVQAVPGPGSSLCVCGCGRLVTGRRELALGACRQRVSRARRNVTNRGVVSIGV